MMIIGLMKAGKNVKQICMLLKLLKVNEHFVYRVLTLFNDTGDIVDWLRSGWPRTALRWWKSYVHRQKTIAKEMNIAP